MTSGFFWVDKSIPPRHYSTIRPIKMQLSHNLVFSEKCLENSLECDPREEIDAKPTHYPNITPIYTL